MCLYPHTNDVCTHLLYRDENVSESSQTLRIAPKCVNLSFKSIGQIKAHFRTVAMCFTLWYLLILCVWRRVCLKPLGEMQTSFHRYVHLF